MAICNSWGCATVQAPQPTIAGNFTMEYSCPFPALGNFLRTPPQLPSHLQHPGRSKSNKSPLGSPCSLPPLICVEGERWVGFWGGDLKSSAFESVLRNAEEIHCRVSSSFLHHTGLQVQPVGVRASASVLSAPKEGAHNLKKGISDLFI